MRQLIDKEMKALLKGATDGILDLRTMPGYDDSLPKVFYAQCTRMEDGAITWEAKHLPMVEQTTWERFRMKNNRNPLVPLTKSECADIVKASIFGRIDEGLLPNVYPLERKPWLCDVLYIGFSKDEMKDRDMLPKMPADWDGQYRGAIDVPPPPGGIEAPWIVFSHFDCEDGIFEASQYYEPSNGEAIDWSTGESIESERMRNLYHNISMGLSIAIG